MGLVRLLWKLEKIFWLLWIDVVGNVVGFSGRVVVVVRFWLMLVFSDWVLVVLVSFRIRFRVSGRFWCIMCGSCFFSVGDWLLC